jgi:hypothetical protein
MNNNTPRNKSNMDKNFGLVQGIQKQRSSFMRSNTWKGTFDCDQLIPCYLDEVLPGDTMDLKMSAVLRLATPLHPIMDNLKVKYEAFFVPMRLVWENTEKFFGEQTNPGDSVSYTIPLLSSSVSNLDSLADYFGLPVGNTAAPIAFNNLPFRCYAKIYDEWYRDQNLQDSLDVVTDNSSGVINNGNWWDVRKRNKQPDYLTTALPWPQKFETTTLPLGETAPVATDASSGSDLSVYETTGSSYNLMLASGTNVSLSAVGGTEANSLYADLSNAGADVNTFRQAVAIQHANEAMARFGSRYPEIIKGRFGVDSEDSRLQRPELLGMGSTYMGIKTVPQTSQTGTTAQGNLAAFGEISLSDKLFTKSFTEHGYVIVLISAVGDITYSQNQEKLWNRSTKDDFYWIEYNGIGEQAIESREIYCDGNIGDDDVFGYQERFGEYRFKTSQVTSLFRPKRIGNLASWHLSEEFASRPTLGDTFIKSNTPMDRAIAVPSEPHLICDMFFQNKSARPMPKFSNPGLSRI